MRPLPAARQTRAADPALINRDDYTIVATYGAEYRGIVQYYLLAGDVYRLHRLRWVMETSMLKTLAAKHRSTVSKMAAKHKAKIDDPARAAHLLRGHASTRNGRKPLVARFGGIPLKRQKTAVLDDRQPDRVDLPAQGTDRPAPERARCEICEQHGQRAGAPRPQARRPRPRRTSPARVGAAHGQPAPQDPRGLRRLPRPHPHRQPAATLTA